MNLPLLAWLYIAIWVLLLNACWLVRLPKNYSHAYWRAGLWVGCIIIILCLGVGLDSITYLKPHSAYVSWEFYATFLIISALLSSPSFLYYKSKR